MHFEAETLRTDPENKVAARILRTLGNAIGLLQSDGSEFESRIKVDESKVVHAIQERLAFIADKNWAEADRIRDELLSEGIQLKDGKDSETGERITTWEVKR